MYAELLSRAAVGPATAVCQKATQELTRQTTPKLTHRGSTLGFGVCSNGKCRSRRVGRTDPKSGLEIDKKFVLCGDFKRRILVPSLKGNAPRIGTRPEGNLIFNSVLCTERFRYSRSRRGRPGDVLRRCVGSKKPTDFLSMVRVCRYPQRGSA